MKKNKIKKINKTTALIISLVLCFIFGFYLNNLTFVSYKSEKKNLKVSAVTTPISIDDTVPGSDWAWASTQPWFGGGTGTSDDPYILEDLTIDGTWSSVCITIQNSDVHFIIRDCTLFNSGGFPGAPALWLDTVSNGTIMENHISDNVRGIILQYCSDNIISNNYIINSTDYYGIRLEHCIKTSIIDNDIIEGYGGIDIFDSNNTIISKNIANDNVRSGLYMTLNYYNNISGNTFQSNFQNGIALTGGSFNNISDNIIYNNSVAGIFFVHYTSGYIPCTHCIITNNIIKYNKQYGFVLTNGSDNQILHNVILNNTYIGLGFSPDSEDNLISENYFLKNGMYHGFDYGMNNDWNTSSIGNYWDNWTSPDSSPKDGIVDNPYPYIYGPMGSIDYLPIAEDGAPIITINSPSTDDAFSTVAPSFDLTVTDIYWDDIWYTIDGGLQNYSCSELGTVDQSAWNGLSDDHHLFTFYASDIVGNVGSNFVWIAKDTTAPVITINSPADGATFGNRPPDFNVSFADDHLDSVWYSVDDGVTLFHVDMIYTDLIIGTINQTAWSALPEGSGTITFYANDTLGHSSSEEVTITKNLPSQIIGMDYFITGFLIIIISGVAIISVIAKIHFKKRLLSN